MFSLKMILLFLRGFAMGSADIVPGVSGGTVAFITGIYGKLVGSIKDAYTAVFLILRFRFAEAKEKLDFAFLIPLFIGLVTALLTMSKLIKYAMHEHPELTWALFFGLMAGSIILVGIQARFFLWRNLVTIALLLSASSLILWSTSIEYVYEKLTGRDLNTFTLCCLISGLLLMVIGKLPFYMKPMRENKLWDSGVMSLFVLFMGLAYTLTIMTPTQTEEGAWMFFFSGSIAIVAMILPGISGSFLLLVMGKYAQVLAALEKLREGDIPAFIAVALPFGLGCIMGLALFAWILNYILKHHERMTFAILLALMVGSMHKIWPFRFPVEVMEIRGKVRVLRDETYFPYPLGQYITEQTCTYAWILMAIGFVFVVVLGLMAQKGMHKSES